MPTKSLSEDDPPSSPPIISTRPSAMVSDNADGELPTERGSNVNLSFDLAFSVLVEFSS